MVVSKMSSVADQKEMKVNLIEQKTVEKENTFQIMSELTAFYNRIKMRLRQILLPIVRRKNLWQMFIMLMLFYIYMSLKIDPEFPIYSRYTKGDKVKTSPVSLNLKRIKMFYRKKGDFFIPASLRQKDWQNYTLIAQEKLHKPGFGEMGKPYFLPDGQGFNILNHIEKYGYNALSSERIQLNRSLPDSRHPNCKKRQYLESLPTASVIVVFYNEHLHTLQRTIYSIVLRSPDELIKEIILVDDASTEDSLKEKLDKFVRRHIPKARVVRLQNRTGLIGARNIGAKLAKGHALIFLDSHTEVNTNWLPPLLEPIALDYRTAVTPVIDGIDYYNLQYVSRGWGARGSFDWKLNYQRIQLTPSATENIPEPFETPVITGMFGISRHFFWELGGFDPELKLWGGENFEISFKIWQCGGRILEVSCSKVGHIYPNVFKPVTLDQWEDTLARNHRRIAEVWMDEYAEYVYARRPNYKSIDPGDLTEQKALRKKLNCKSFKWYITQIAFDLAQKNPMVDPIPYAEGRIRPKINPHLCIDGNHGMLNDLVVLKLCRTGKTRPKCDEQLFSFTWYNDVTIKDRPMCWDLPDARIGGHVKLYPCHHNGGNQQWKYDEETKQIIFHKYKCLDHNPKNRDLFINFCFNDTDSQMWEIDVVHSDRLAKWNISNTWSVTGPEEEWLEEDEKKV